MASWLAHSRYIPIREGLIGHLRRSKYRFRKLDPVIFLCGGLGSKSRDAIRAYLSKHSPDLDLFYAEKVWDEIAALGHRDALQMEEDSGEAGRPYYRYCRERGYFYRTWSVLPKS
jgi:hypothetical protein